MPISPSVRLRALATLTAAAVVATGFLGVAPAFADTTPAPGVVATVTDDVLPTAQINGVAWAQVVIGNTVYVGGNFSTARPAGSAAGANTVTRGNILAYDITTGALLPFAPRFNGQVRSLAASPDGSRLYVAGQFTSVTIGATTTTRNRIAGFTTANGALITGFNPNANGPVDAVKATADAVFLSGNFTQVRGVARAKAAAVVAATNALTPFAPNVAGGRALALVVSPAGDKVILGGSFTTLNGQGDPNVGGAAGYGLGAVAASDGSTVPLPAAQRIKNGGADASIYSLSSDSTSVYGTAYHFGGGGNLEGPFQIDWNTGDIVWVADCHGDTYSAFASSGVVYVAGHPHYCSNIGGYPQTDPWHFQRGLAFAKSYNGNVNGGETLGYASWEGVKAPDLLTWYPDFNTGTASGSNQGPWSVAANANYVAYAGEFTRVNNILQQGLVRFAVKAIAPNKDGPRLSGSSFVPSVKSFASGQARITWLSNYDRDNESLTYDVIRDGNNNAPIYTVVGKSRIWYDRPTLSYTDKSAALTPGSTHTYTMRATDPSGNRVYGSPVSVTISTGTISSYAQSVLDDNALNYWRLGDSAGSTTASDWAGADDATVGSGVTFGQTGAIGGDSNKAALFTGDSSGLVAGNVLQQGSNSLSVEAWFKTTSTSGGKIVGFGNSNTGDSSAYDRHIMMAGDGTVYWGVYDGNLSTLQSAPGLNDGQWHQVVGALSSTGMQLFIDGVRIGTRLSPTLGQSYSGYWRIGGDSSWYGDNYFDGSIDDVAIYGTALTRDQVGEHYTLSGRTASVPTPPSDVYGAAVYADEPSTYWRLGEATTATTAADTAGLGNTGTYKNNVIKPVSGAIAGTSNTAASFDGVSSLVSGNKSVTNPRDYSLELWFKADQLVTGGKLIGLGDQQDGTSNNYDRHVYIENTGQLTFGTWTGQTNTVTSPLAYTDSAWHHVVAEQSAAGMKLYIDGALVGTNPNTDAQGYTGYWRIGGDNAWGGTTPWFRGAIDEVAIYDFPLTGAQIANHYTKAGGSVVNAAPTAAFTSTTNGLQATFDGSTSSDSDGTISSYAWAFSDSGTASGPNPTHTFAAGGTYQATLTVTDNGGLPNSVSHDITVAPTADTAPTASFTFNTSGLTANVNGSGSTDAEGPIASYAWTFGDGGTANTATASHTYLAANTYTVTLTVTDSGGLTNSVSHDITVSSSTAIASDDFGRTTSSSWGTAVAGGPWTTSGTATAFSTNGAGNITAAKAGLTAESYLNGVSSTSTDSKVKIRFNQAAVGGSVYASVIGRRVGTVDYRSRIVIGTNGAVNLQLLRGGTYLANIVVAGLTYTAGDELNLRLQVTGTSPTTARARVWKTGTAEPATWQVSATDSTAGLQTAGAVGLASYTGGSVSSLPMVLSFDDYTVVAAQ